MTLREKRCIFTTMLTQLIMFAEAGGYEVSIDVVKTSQDRSPNSLHRIGLAADLNLYRAGAYLKKTEDHKRLGAYWQSLGGYWGGQDGNHDGNHYSLPHEGRW